MRSVFPMPRGLSVEEACTVPVVFLTSWFALMKRAGLRAGETVLVQSAGSGCGIAGIAIAKWAGATVITTAGSDDKVQRGIALGLTRGELSWTLEDNELVNAGIEAAGGRRYKTYRLYEKSLD